MPPSPLVCVFGFATRGMCRAKKEKIQKQARDALKVKCDDSLRSLGDPSAGSKSQKTSSSWRIVFEQNHLLLTQKKRSRHFPFLFGSTSSSSVASFPLFSVSLSRKFEQFKGSLHARLKVVSLFGFFENFQNSFSMKTCATTRSRLDLDAFLASCLALHRVRAHSGSSSPMPYGNAMQGMR
jgi:hypothetical protein